MARLTNIGDSVNVYRPAGSADSLLVEAGQVHDVPGEITEETDDCYIVGAGDDARAWPKAQWELAKAAGKKPDKATDES